jgi:hypothetical protein
MDKKHPHFVCKLKKSLMDLNMLQGHGMKKKYVFSTSWV